MGGSRTYHLRQRYGITAADADAMLAHQGGLCAICKESPAAHVDHDHASGKVRGLLCFNCNGGLGQFKDRIDVLEAAVVYLEGHTGDTTAPLAGEAQSEHRWPRVIELFPYRGGDIDLERWQHTVGV